MVSRDGLCGLCFVWLPQGVLSVFSGWENLEWHSSANQMSVVWETGSQVVFWSPGLCHPVLWECGFSGVLCVVTRRQVARQGGIRARSGYY